LNLRPLGYEHSHWRRRRLNCLVRAGEDQLTVASMSVTLACLSDRRTSRCKLCCKRLPALVALGHRRQTQAPETPSAADPERPASRPADVGPIHLSLRGRSYRSQAGNPVAKIGGRRRGQSHRPGRASRQSRPALGTLLRQTRPQRTSSRRRSPLRLGRARLRTRLGHRMKRGSRRRTCSNSAAAAKRAPPNQACPVKCAPRNHALSSNLASSNSPLFVNLEL